MKTTVIVSGNRASVMESPLITSGTVGMVVQFEFDDQWQQLEKIAVFKAGHIIIDQIIDGNQSIIPWEVLTKPNRNLDVGIYGTNDEGTIVIPTVWVSLGRIQPGADPSGDPAIDPTTPFWRQISKDSVFYTKQEGKTEEEKSIARANIGAAPAQPKADEKYFDITVDGVVSLKPEYRGLGAEKYAYSISDNGLGNDGSKIHELPEMLVIPDVINRTAVTGFQPSMFQHNYRIKEVTIPDAVTELSDRIFNNASSLRAVHNTEKITKLGHSAFMYTKIEKAIFPNLREVSTAAFGGCGFLYLVDIGNYITNLPKQMFMYCSSLSCVKGGEKVTAIGDKAFAYTRNLKNLPLLSNVTSIENSAFYNSRIQFDWDSIRDQCTIDAGDTPVIDNTTDYWTAVNETVTPCENPILTIMSQTDPKWVNDTFGDSGVTYEVGCAAFTALHIHSALSGKRYNHPDEFAEELSNTSYGTITKDKHPMYIANVKPIMEALGYTATEYTGSITQASYQAMCDALARGAYIFMEVSTATNSNNGHVVAIYGIDENKEVLVLDSSFRIEVHRGYDRWYEFYTYRMPHQNLCGPYSRFVVIEKEA